MHASENVNGSAQARKARERAGESDGGMLAQKATVDGNLPDGCSDQDSEMTDRISPSNASENDNSSSISPSNKALVRPPDAKTDTSQQCSGQDGHTKPKSVRQRWEEEGEVEICVGTLDEEFLVGKRGKDREVIPGTGYGAMVAHPEGRVLWGENDIKGVTDMVSGTRWKYGVSSGIMLEAGVLISGHL